MPESAKRAVFLSYASQDAEAAHRICSVLRDAGAAVWCLAFSCDGRWLVSGSSDHTVRIWHLITAGTLHPAGGHAAAGAGP